MHMTKESNITLIGVILGGYEGYAYPHFLEWGYRTPHFWRAVNRKITTQTQAFSTEQDTNCQTGAKSADSCYLGTFEPNGHYSAHTADTISLGYTYRSMVQNWFIIWRVVVTKLVVTILQLLKTIIQLEHCRDSDSIGHFYALSKLHCWSILLCQCHEAWYFTVFFSYWEMVPPLLSQKWRLWSLWCTLENRCDHLRLS